MNLWAGVQAGLTCTPWCEPLASRVLYPLATSQESRRPGLTWLEALGNASSFVVPEMTWQIAAWMASIFWAVIQVVAAHGAPLPMAPSVETSFVPVRNVSVRSELFLSRSMKP